MATVPLKVANNAMTVIPPIQMPVPLPVKTLFAEIASLELVSNSAMMETQVIQMLVLVAKTPLVEMGKYKPVSNNATTTMQIIMMGVPLLVSLNLNVQLSSAFQKTPFLMLITEPRLTAR
ncbi:MAG: hypothetical protein A2979_03220 [Deltaproteobacteria bacterium RIFCSPLOWO2_01_FULL_45_74]|nr:MAG: hypothetical protein A2712_00115 [Deltaproteobacteria bacterium RIFCSPHIGHO2_01_FULL_43_49]OGQ15824.1 MAG: hypothetical protein A3D22_02765 [Deltaproteobacteria bacterium RIFCSPHIGHO2_02_FULL_44_53]OGQ28778.1 MAG: hypothetical protein A3D98_01095 [Deltaproteobacteria bacterium RIFCSPHIGHO2_12_FULL_44_21]OGQ32098.1 MAG: hypothetical protein A2979_03220 [Deltaproteobacteria bacterium RIFCSPLOWO2_01_FULL_45_74]